MSEPQSYKNRTVQVRSSARAHLKELRQQRINRRKAAVSAGQPCAIDAVTNEAALSETHDSEVQKTPTSSFSDEFSAPEHEAMDDFAVENAAMSEMEQDVTLQTGFTADAEPTEVASCDEASQGPEVRAGEPVSADLEAPSDGQESAISSSLVDETIDEAIHEQVSADMSDVAPSDLETLPGAGPGLVWMLQKCGINSLADLATATPEQLSEDLGVVGQILDVSQWIEFAKT